MNAEKAAPKLVEKPPTMRQMLDTVARKVDYLASDLERRRNQPVTNAAAPPMTEPRALNECMEALTALVEAERRARQNSSSNYDYMSSSGGWPTGGSSVDRILRHLAARYGVQLIEVSTEPCSRAHVDSIDVLAIQDALARAARQT